MIILVETPAGFPLFKVKDEGKLANLEDLGKELKTPDSARKIVKLKAFDKSDNTSEALEGVVKLHEGTPSSATIGSSSN